MRCMCVFVNVCFLDAFNGVNEAQEECCKVGLLLYTTVRCHYAGLSWVTQHGLHYRPHSGMHLGAHTHSRVQPQLITASWNRAQHIHTGIKWVNSSNETVWAGIFHCSACLVFVVVPIQVSLQGSSEVRDSIRLVINGTHAHMHTQAHFSRFTVYT